MKIIGFKKTRRLKSNVSEVKNQKTTKVKELKEI